MIKFAVYLSLTGVGIVWALSSPTAGLIACLEAYLLNPVKITGDEFTFRYQLWTTLAFLVGVLLHKRGRVARVGNESVPLKALWIFVFVAVASSTWAVVSGAEAIAGAYEVLKTVLIASLVPFVVRTERSADLVITACILGALHACFMHTFGVRLGYVYAGLGREAGVVPDGQTAVMVLFLPLVVVIAALGKNKFQRFCALITLPVAINSIVSTYMRAGLVAIAAELLILLVLLPKRLLLSSVPLLAGIVLLFFFRLTPENYWSYMNTIMTPTEEASANSRFVLTATSMRILADYPMGVGYSNYSEVSPRYLDPSMLTNGRRSAHNSFLAIACETGIIGFVCWTTAFVGAALLLRRLRSRGRAEAPQLANYALGLEVGLYGWFVTGFFHGDHEADPAYWFVGLAVALTRVMVIERSQRETSASELLVC